MKRLIKGNKKNGDIPQNVGDLTMESEYSKLFDISYKFFLTSFILRINHEKGFYDSNDGGGVMCRAGADGRLGV
jgi:hypothetical protein